RERDQGGGDAEEDVIANFESPERIEADARKTAPTFDAHAAAVAEKADFAKFVIANDEAEFGIEFLAEFGEAFADALASGVIADTDGSAVAGVIAISDDEIGVGGGGE